MRYLNEGLILISLIAAGSSFKLKLDQYGFEAVWNIKEDLVRLIFFLLCYLIWRGRDQKAGGRMRVHFSELLGVTVLIFLPVVSSVLWS